MLTAAANGPLPRTRFREGKVLTKRRLKRGVLCSVVDLQAAINRFIDDAPKPFVWTADPDKIIAAINRGHQALDSIQQQPPTPAAIQRPFTSTHPLRQ